MSREAAQITVSLYPTLAAFSARVAGAVFVEPSQHQALRQAAYALAGVAPCAAPPGRWVAAQCRSSDGAWERLLFSGET